MSFMPQGLAQPYRPALRARDVNAGAEAPYAAADGNSGPTKENGAFGVRRSSCSALPAAAPGAAPAAPAPADAAALRGELEAARAEAAELRSRLAGAAERGCAVARERGKLADRCAALEADAAQLRAQLAAAQAAAADAAAAARAEEVGAADRALGGMRKALAAALESKRTAVCAVEVQLGAATQRADALVRPSRATHRKCGCWPPPALAR